MTTPWRRWIGRVRSEPAEQAQPEADPPPPIPRENPRLLRYRWDGSSVQLVFTDGSGTDLDLLLVGRKSARQQGFPTSRSGSDSISATIGAEDLSTFGSEIIDLFLATGDRPRRRVTSDGLDSGPQRGAPRRLYVTVNGNASFRRPSAAEIIEEAGVFDADVYRAQVPELPAEADLIEHYVSTGAALGLNPSSAFDTRYYRAMNPSIRQQNPLAHYCDSGWKTLVNPSPTFNTWWYWAKHLDLASEDVNPLAHYEAVGKRAHLSTMPDPEPSRSLDRSQQRVTGRPVKRVCLFAGYDPDGIVDDYVVDYLRELSRFADIYYLADCEMPPSQLARLAPYTRRAWAQRHGEYDFGSYARLATAVTWEKIEQYDELLLANDSCYLLRPLDEVFEQMDQRACAWWSLQATKGLYQTREAPSNTFSDPIPMDLVRTSLLDSFEQDYIYDFHLASFFVAYRSSVIADPEFRRYLGSVTAQTRKRDIVKKYEIGLTHWLIQHGHAFDTFIPSLYPFHPVFSNWYFQMLRDGFPLLKRQFLAENLYRIPRLGEWSARVAREVPGVDLGLIERNLERVTDPGKLAQSLNIVETTPDRLRS